MTRLKEPPAILSPAPSVSGAGAKERIFFYRLNQLRIFPAAVVFVTHVEVYKWLTGHPHGNIASVMHLGHQCVNFFFVLSGFLITYLMLYEQIKTGTVNVFNFYRRRMLRVWPLYFLITAVSFFVVPSLFHYAPETAPRLAHQQAQFAQNFAIDLGLFALVLPNIQLLFFGAVHCAAQSWTVGVEEQFYAIWPLLLKISRRRPWVIMLACIAIKAMAVAALFALSELSYAPALAHASYAAMKFAFSFDIEALALGSLGAYLLLFAEHSSLVCLIRSKAAILIAFSALIAALSCPATTNFLQFDRWDFACSILYTGVIMALAAPSAAPTGLFGKMLNYAGTITYGFYMFNIFAICTVLALLSQVKGISDASLTYNIVLYAGAFALSMLFSCISYEFYESRFLKLKSRFSYVVTSPQKL